MLFAQENQFIRFKMNRCAGRHFFSQQIEYFACGGIASWPEQHNIVIIQMALNGIGIDCTNFAG